MGHRGTSAWKVTKNMVLSEAESHNLLQRLASKYLNKDANNAAHLRVIVDHLIVSCLIHSGLSNSEFCVLRLGDTVVGTGESSFRVVGRRNQTRIVHLPHGVSCLVASYARKIRPRLLPAGISPEDLDRPLVLSERGGAYHRTGLYRRVVRILTESGLGDRASVHLFRHTYGFLAYARTGGNLLFVQRQLGHAHPRITSVYADLVEESYEELAERIDLEPSSVQTAIIGGSAREAPSVDQRLASVVPVKQEARHRRHLSFGETD